MGQRNMLCTRQMLDMEVEQGQTHLQPDPCIHFGNAVDYPNPNMHPVLSTSRNSTVDLCHLPEHHESSIFSGNHYNSLQHHPPVINNLDLSGAASSNFYNSYMIPSSASRISHMPLDHSTSNCTSAANNHAVNRVNVDDYGRDNRFVDNARVSCKRKNAEEFPGNYYYVDGSSSSSSSSMSLSPNPGLQQWEEFEPEAGVLDATVFTPPEYRGNGNLSITEGSQRSVRSRATSAINLQLDCVLAHHHNHLVQGNYTGQSFQPSNNAWTEPFGSTSGDGGTSNWNYTPAVPCLHGRNVDGGLEIGSVGGHGHRDLNRNSAVLSHPHLVLHRYHPTPMQGMPVHGYSYLPHIQIPSYRHPTNSNLHEGALNSSQDGLESGSGYPRSFSSRGDRMYRSHRRVPQVASEDINGRMRFLSSEDVAILEFSGFYGAGNFVDQHRDMRLDIDDMSYEELLALEERIGDVCTGLTEETISKCLKTRQHVSCAASFPPEQSKDMAQENETCIICQVEYEENENIGTLDCGHKYHADCIKQWLLVKNVCPICKMSALSVGKREG